MIDYSNPSLSVFLQRKIEGLANEIIDDPNLVICLSGACGSGKTLTASFVVDEFISYNSVYFDMFSFEPMLSGFFDREIKGNSFDIVIFDDVERLVWINFSDVVKKISSLGIKVLIVSQRPLGVRSSKFLSDEKGSISYYSI